MTPPPPPERVQILRFPSDLALAETLATRWIELLAAAPAGRPFNVALSGGRIARRLLAAAARLGRARHTDWSRCHFFWGDERGVPADHPESNFRAAQEEFLAPAGIAAVQIHRIAGELPPPEAARQAREELRRQVPANPAGLPVLDLVFLGLGEGEVGGEAEDLDALGRRGRGHGGVGGAE
ncbi:MAG: 6-phosphogluconolactonase, partial [Verrucomicrobiota bacterium]